MRAFWGEMGGCMVLTPPSYLSVESLAQQAGASAVAPPPLDYLKGLRCLVSLWIVCRHFAGPGGATLWRSTAGVTLCVVLSGFVSSLAYARRRTAGRLPYGLYAVRRVARVAPLYYISLAVAVALGVAAGQGFPPLPVALECLAGVRTWVGGPDAFCPAGESWTIVSLIPCWLLWPALSDVLQRSSAVEVWAYAAALFAAVPSLALYLAQGGHLTYRQHSWLYFYPPAMIPDFVAGAVVGEVVRRRREFNIQPSSSNNETRLSCAADATFAVAVLLVVSLPSRGYRQDSDALVFTHGMTPLICAFLFLASASEASICRRILQHPASLPSASSPSTSTFGKTPSTPHSPSPRDSTLPTPPHSLHTSSSSTSSPRSTPHFSTSPSPPGCARKPQVMPPHDTRKKPASRRRLDIDAFETDGGS